MSSDTSPYSRKPAHYNSWHRRELADSFWFCDVDGVEVRKDRGIVGFFELSEAQTRSAEDITFEVIKEEKGFVLDCVLLPLSRSVKIPVFVVYHSPACSWFKVFKFSEGEYTGSSLLTEAQYRELVRTL